MPANALDGFVRSLAHLVARFPTAGQVVVKERVNAVALAPADDFRRDSDLLGASVRDPEAQRASRRLLKRGFQTREAEMSLGRLLGNMADH